MNDEKMPSTEKEMATSTELEMRGRMMCQNTCRRLAPTSRAASTAWLATLPRPESRISTVSGILSHTRPMTGPQGVRYGVRILGSPTALSRMSTMPLGPNTRMKA
ncbi:hypothetical protein D3C72_2021540 [compost metagenome]